MGWLATTINVSLAAAASAALGCTLDRAGLTFRASGEDAGLDVAADIHQVEDLQATQHMLDAPLASDLNVDVPVAVLDAPAAPDLRMDAPVEMGVTCDPALGVHRCGTACVSNLNVASCGPTSCAPCPVPPNGTATCDGTSCGVACSPGFMAQASACVPACRPACDASATTVPLPGGRFTGRTAGVSMESGSCGGGSAPEHVYRLVLAVTSDLFVTTHGTAFDTAIYIRRGCCGAEVACNDNADGRQTSVLSQPALPPGTYDVFVDGAAAGALGAYTVDIYATPTSGNPGDSCGRPLRIANLPVSGNTCGYADDYDPQNGCTDVSNSGPDAVYYFVLDAPTSVTFDTCTGTCIDSMLYTREVCTMTATQGTCDDDSCSAPENCADHPTQSRATDMLGAGVHYLVVDTYPTPPVCGPFMVTATGVPP